MANSSIPLDVVRLIMDELVCDSAEHSVIGGSPPWKALQQCAETCKAWAPEAQKRLFRRLVLSSPSRFYTSRRQPDLSRLLATMEFNTGWINHIRVLHIHGRWVMPHSDFPTILQLISQHGRLQTFLWDMACQFGCPHWNRFPSALRKAVGTLLQCPTLTAVKLRGTCQEFPLETLGRSPLKHLEIAGEAVEDHITLPNDSSFDSSFEPAFLRAPFESRVYLDSLELDGPAIRRLPYYMNSSEFRLDLSRLSTLTINEFDTLVVIQHLLHFCNTSIQRLSWKFNSIFLGDHGEDEIDYSLVPLDFCSTSLQELRTVDIHARLSTEYMKYYHRHRGYQHLAMIVRVLKECDFPKTVETINLAIEHCPNPVDADLGIDPHENLRHDLHILRIDQELARLVATAKGHGHLRVVNLTIVLRELESLTQRYGIGGGITEVHDGADIDGSALAEDDYVEEQYLERKLVEWFPLLRATGIAHLTVLGNNGAFRTERDLW